MKLTLRLVTIFCYFLPFTFFFMTCNDGFELRVSYNQADKNILLENGFPQVAVADSAQYDRQISVDTINKNTSTPTILTDSINKSSDTIQKSSDYGDKILRKILFPSDKSISAIGSIFYFKNLAGQIAIAICILIALILFVSFRFLKSQKVKLYLILTSTFCLTIFIVDSLISNVTLLWGCWTLLAVLILQLVIEFNDKKKALN